MSEQDFDDRFIPQPEEKDDGSFGMEGTDKYNAKTEEEVRRKVKEMMKRNKDWEEDPRVI